MPHESVTDVIDGSEDDGFTEFAVAAWPRLVRTAQFLTGDFHEAEDLVQTTLAKVYSRWRRVPRGEVDLYVRRALINNNLEAGSAASGSSISSRRSCRSRCATPRRVTPRRSNNAPPCWPRYRI